MQLFNLDYIKQLQEVVKHEEERHYFVALSIYIGSYKARKELTPEGYFSRFRDVTSKIAEAKYIASQCKETLDLLKAEKENDVKRNLEMLLEETNKNDVVSSKLSRLIKSSGRQFVSFYLIGDRIEKKFLNADEKEYEDYRNDPCDRELNRLFLKEEEIMRHAMSTSLRVYNGADEFSS